MLTLSRDNLKRNLNEVSITRYDRTRCARSEKDNRNKEQSLIKAIKKLASLSTTASILMPSQITTPCLFRELNGKDSGKRAATGIMTSIEEAGVKGD